MVFQEAFRVSSTIQPSSVPSVEHSPHSHHLIWLPNYSHQYSLREKGEEEHLFPLSRKLIHLQDIHVYT